MFKFCGIGWAGNFWTSVAIPKQVGEDSFCIDLHSKACHCDIIICSSFSAFWTYVTLLAGEYPVLRR